MADDPREEGLQYERDTADLLGGELQPGSGNMWFAKLDVGVRVMLIGLKHTRQKSLSLTRSLLLEVIQHATKIGNRGAIPAIGTKVAGEDLITMRMQDFALLLQEGVKLTPIRKADLKRARADTPLILRREQESGDGAG